MKKRQDKADAFYFKILDWIILTWSGWIAVIVLLLLLMWFSKPLIDDAFLQGRVQELLLGFVAFALLITILNVFEIRKILRHRSYLESSLKFRAEVLAGLSIFSFFAQLSQVGSALDRLSPAERLSQVPVIAQEIYTKSRCANSTQFLLCHNLENNLLRLEFYVAIRSEREVDTAISQLKLQMSSFTPPLPPSPQLLKKLDGLNRSDNKITWFLLFVPIFTLLCASLAISTKIALAWPKKTKIPSPAAENGNAPELNPKIASIKGSVDVSGLVKVEKPGAASISLAAAALAMATLVYIAARAMEGTRHEDDN